MTNTKKCGLICTILLLFSLLITSCSDSTNEEVTVVATATVTTAATIIDTTSVPAPTIPIVMPTATSFPVIQTQCVSDVQESKKLELSGVVVFRKISHQLNSPLGLDFLDPNTGRVISTDDRALVTKVSSDKKHLAYAYDTYDDSHYIRILDGSGRIVSDFADFPAYPNGIYEDYFDWQNPDQLRIVTSNINDVRPYLINPFTQERTDVETKWSGDYRPINPYQAFVADWKFDRDATKRYYVYGANILYDPTLSRVVDPKKDKEVVLVDVNSKTELAFMEFTDWGRLPSWSFDGKHLAILNREGDVEEFYLIDRDGGEFQRITDFSSEFEYVFIPEYTWSPDGSQIAFWLELENENRDDGPQSELAILDISTRQVTRLCIEGMSSNSYEPWAMNHPEPIWSPDGRYLLITQWDNPDARRDYYVLVVDPITDYVERISKNTAPVGWMKKE